MPPPLEAQPCPMAQGTSEGSSEEIAPAALLGRVVTWSLALLRPQHQIPARKARRHPRRPRPPTL